MSIHQYVSAKSFVLQNVGDNNYKVISNILDSIDKQIEQANNLAESLYIDVNVVNQLRREPSTVNDFDIQKRQAIQSIGRKFEAMPVTNYILSLFVLGENGLDLRNGAEGAMINPEDFRAADWFKKGMEANGKMYWGGISRNFTKITKQDYVIPQHTVIKDLASGNKLGTLLVLYSPSMFSDSFKEMMLNQEERMYLVDDQGNILATNQPEGLGDSIGSKQYFKQLLNGAAPFYFETKIEDSSSLVVYKKSLKTGWTLLLRVPVTQVEEQKAAAIKPMISIVIIVVLLCILFSYYFFRNLLEESVQKEKEKRIAEIRMLQSQINPHFLYNTLNSIKVMASMQGSKGIEHMVSALGRLLKDTLSGVNDKITLREELSILEDYMYIQKIRYKGKVQFTKHVSDEHLLQCKILKFMFQPIIENAIFHGIEPKDEAGEIVLTAYRQGDRLVIEVWDNGIGMTQEKMASIRKHVGSPGAVEQENGIGFHNINQRIKLVYGEEYGLHFESLAGEFTKVTVQLPLEMT